MPTHLILVAGPLAVLCECGETLVDELHVVGVNVEAEQYQPPCGDATYAVEEPQRLEDEITVGLAVSLGAEIVLEGSRGGGGGEGRIRRGGGRWRRKN